jgi:hypothetical protein
LYNIAVAPFAGAWIEIPSRFAEAHRKVVAPFAGAWIEIIEKHNTDDPDASLPSRERGLK